MASLPTGTVTFLFTDIEGSTRLLQHLGARYADALIQYRQLLRTAVQERGGREVDTQGDALFVAFQSAQDALAAAVAAQRAIIAHTWPDGASLQVRMGLHTGEALAAETGYVGLDVHRTARICAAGHGGQILLSEPTRILVKDDLPNGVGLRDLGEHRLKDLAHPQHLFQAVAAELPADFPPLKSLDVVPTNLPLQLTSFVGREREIAEVKRLLPTTRLLTLTGTGGAGKTRLALHVAADVLEEFPNGVWLVELAALTDPALVPHTIASALRIREASGSPMLATLLDYLQTKKLLLMLDNCEHLIEACAHLAEAMLRACPHLRILATSREPLGVPGELAWRVPSLSLPEPGRLPSPETLMKYGAVRLFIERAAVGQPTFTLTPQNSVPVAAVVQRLDGIPLSIELAAARVQGLSVEQIAGRLDDLFRLLTRGSRTSPPRHQTLQGVLDWSYHLLSEAEQLVLRRLAVFAGGWTLEAAEEVCGGGVESFSVLDLLTQLVFKSLVLMDERGGEVRYRFLETVRQYSWDKLSNSGEIAKLRERHRDWYLRLVERAEAELRGPNQRMWLERLETEHDNLRAALEWTKLEEGGTEPGLRLVGSLWRFWRNRGYWSEGRRWLEAALERSSYTSTASRAKALNGAGDLAMRQGDYAFARSFSEESLAIWRQLGDKAGIARSLHILGIGTYEMGDYDAARSMYEESLAISRELGENKAIADSLNDLGIVARRQSDFAVARSLHEESLAIRRALGDKVNIAVSLNNLGVVVLQQSDYAMARALFEESLRLAREVGARNVYATALNSAGDLACAQGDNVAAYAFYKESLTILQQLMDRRGIADCLDGLAKVASAQGRHERAARLFGAAEALREAISLMLPPADRADYDRNVYVVRAALDEVKFGSAWAEGRTMTLEQAIEYALSDA